MKNKELMLYIGGTGRSGTSILRKVLAQHSQIADVPEWRFMIDPKGLMEFYRDIDHMNIYEYTVKVKGLHAVLKSCTNSNLIAKTLSRLDATASLTYKMSPAYSNVDARNVSPNFNILTDQLISTLTEKKYFGSWAGMKALETKTLYLPQDKDIVKSAIYNFLKDVRNDVLKNQKKSIYLEKNTWNILWFDLIRELFPAAKLLHIYRDPRAVVSSYMQQRWMPQDASLAAEAYKLTMSKWYKVRKNIPAESYLEVSLEALIDKQSETVENICSFFQMDVEEALINFPLRKDSMVRWKNDLSDSEQTQVNRILDQFISDYRYEH